MAKIVRTARGEKLDMDLFHMKQKMIKQSVTVEVKDRENFVEAKMKRRIKKFIKSAEDAATVKPETNKVQGAKIQTTPQQPMVESKILPEDVMDQDPSEEKAPAPSKPKRVRKPAKTEDTNNEAKTNP